MQDDIFANEAVSSKSTRACSSSPATTKKKKNRNHSDRIAAVRKGFEETALDIRAAIRNAESVSGSCSFRSCVEPAETQDLMQMNSAKYCKKHAIKLFRRGKLLVDVLGNPIRGGEKGHGKVLCIYLNGWVYRKKPCFTSEYYPGTPKDPRVYFHYKLMNQAYNLAKGGLAANRIWDFICQDYHKAPPEKCYKQFLNALTEIFSWKTLDQNLILTQSAQADRSDLDFVPSCPCCFGDKNTTKNIILVRVGF